MKSITVATITCLVASASAFTAPLYATRAISKPAVAKKSPFAKKAPLKKVVSKVAPKKTAAPKKKLFGKKAPVAAPKTVAPKKKLFGGTKVVAKSAPKKAAPKKFVKPAKAAPKKFVKPAKAAPKKFVKPAKAAPKKFVKKAVVSKKAAPKKFVKKQVAKKTGPKQSGGYISFADAASKIKFVGYDGGGNKPVPAGFAVPDFSVPSLQKTRDPSFYAAAAKRRKDIFSSSKTDFAYDDGLTAIERKQKGSLDKFLAGSAKNVNDKTLMRNDVVADTLIFGLSPDRFQLLFIAVFGVFTLVGALSGNLNL